MRRGTRRATQGERFGALQAMRWQREYLDATKIARGFLCKRLRRLDFTTIRIESPQDVHTARSRPEMHASERAQTPKSKDARAEIARLSQRKRLRRADATQR